MARPNKRQLAERKQAKASERHYERDARDMRRWEDNAAADAVMATCEGCGLEQVSPGPPCVVCGGEIGVYAGPLPGR